MSETPAEESTFSLYRTCAIALPTIQLKPSTNHNETNSVVTRTDNLWPNGHTIKYSFHGGSPNQRNKVENVAKTWSEYANVAFERLPDGDKGLVRISFDRKQGCWSYLGTAIKDVEEDKMTMNLGCIKDSTTTSPDESGVILHEFGHTLGLMHEHQSPTRGGKLKLKEAETYAYYMSTQDWDRDTVKEQVLDVYNEDDVSNYSEIDLTSIMMYFMHAELNEQGIEVPVNNALSNLDKAFMAICYPRYESYDGAPLWDLEYALQVARVPDATAAQIKAAKNNVIKIRRLFSKHTANERANKAVRFRAPKRQVSEFRGWCGTKEDLEVTSTPAGVQYGFTTHNQLWAPNSTIKYGFLQDASISTPLRRERISDALNVYGHYTNLTFVLEDITGIDFNIVGNRETYPVRICFGKPFQETGVSLSTVGFAYCGTDTLTAENPGGKGVDVSPWTTVYLSGQPSVLDDADLMFYNDGGMMTDEDLEKADFQMYHELGHIMGLRHEAESPHSEIGKPDSLPDDLLQYVAATLFDEQSVMLYSDLQYRNDPSRKTKMNTFPSATDLYLLAVMYPGGKNLAAELGPFDIGLRALDFRVNKREELLKQASVALLSPDTSEIERATLVADLRADITKNLKVRPRPPITVNAATMEAKLKKNDPSINDAELAELLLLLSSDVGVRKRKLGKSLFESGKKRSVNPLHSIGGPGAGGNADMRGFLEQLIESLKKFFNPGGNQIFTLQFPGRFLDQATYAWDTKLAGIYGQFIKPTAVNEAEFRLVDQLYELSDRVGGPNGSNLSIVYEQLIHNLLSKPGDKLALVKQQSSIRDWLLQDVPSTTLIDSVVKQKTGREKALAKAFAVSRGEVVYDDEENVVGEETTKGMPAGDGKLHGTQNAKMISRIERSQLLMGYYLEAKQDWELERDELIRQASQADMGTPESQKALNELTRKLAHITASRQAQLASKYADAVVRGDSHTVREYMGYLDITSPAEILQNAKDSLRESAMSSLDGAMKVYPVVLSPLDWFEGLSTSFTLEDLTSDPEIIRAHISAKAQQLDVLNSQLVMLQIGVKGDPEALQRKVESARIALDSAKSALAQAYTTNVISVAKTFMDASGNVDVTAVGTKLSMAKDLLAGLPDMLKAVNTAQDNLTASSRALSQTLTASALAEATDSRQQQEQLKIQIRSITHELNQLEGRWKSLTVKSGGISPPKPLDQRGIALPPGPPNLPAEQSSGDSRWQTITLSSSKASRETASRSSASSSVKNMSCNFWLGSYNSSSQESSASAQASSSASTDTVDLAFRATLVTVDRGGWFQPSLMKQSAAFYRITKDISWHDQDNGRVKGLLPGFPVAFLLAKDIVIKVTNSAGMSSSDQSSAKSAHSSAGGILCFSYSASDSSSSESSSTSFQEFSNGFIVKIPGPQILGYMIQKMDDDRTEPMPKVFPADTIIDTNEPLRDPKPALQHAPEPESPPKKDNFTPERIRAVMKQILDEKMDDIFSNLKSET